MAIPVLMYHAIHPARSPISIYPDVFSQQMRWLNTSGYQVISLRHLADCLRRAEALPARSVVLTFDDGYRSVYERAFPILAEYGFSATIFLVAGHCGGYNDWFGQPVGIPRLPLLNWEQAREMERAGFDIGAHTVTHARLDRFSETQLRSEVLGSQALIAEKLGCPVRSFAYPYGRLDAKVSQLVRENYSVACSSRLGLVTSASDPYALERVEVLYLQPELIFRGLDQPWFPGYLQARKIIRQAASSLLHRPWA